MTTSVRPPAPRSAVDDVLPVERAAAAYFALQATMGVVLWVAADLSATVRSWLELVPDRPEVTDAFLPADVIVIITSALAAWGLWRGRTWAMAPALMTVGGIVYPTVYLVAWTATTEGSGDVALGMMVVATTLCCGAAMLAWRARRR